MRVKVTNDKIRGLLSSRENVFKLAESEDFISIAYETGMVYENNEDTPVRANSIVTIDFEKEMISGSTALVHEWFLSGWNDATLIEDQSYFPNVSAEFPL